MIMKFFNVAVPMLVIFGVLTCIMMVNGLFWGGAF